MDENNTKKSSGRPSSSAAACKCHAPSTLDENTRSNFSTV